MFLHVLVLIFLNAVIDKSTAQFSNGGQCTTPNRTPGTCIYLEQCTELYGLVTSQTITSEQVQYLRQSQCGRQNNKVLICCPNNAQFQSRPPAQQQQGYSPPSSGGRPPTRLSSSSTAGNLLPSPGVCGKGVEQKIFGGETTQIDEFPWMALIEYSKQGNNKGYHCGGSLINNRYVLTAAHCIKGEAVPRDWSVKRVRLGEWDTSTDRDCVTDINGYEDCADPVVDVNVESIKVHENYVPTSSQQYNDIALLRLSRSVQYTDYISPICLPASNLRRSSLNGLSMDVAGWGKTETRSKSNIKLKAAVDVVPLSSCNSVYAKNKITLLDTQMCAGGLEGIDSCSGDSGGPLIAADRTNRARPSFYLAGIVSFGPTSCGLRGWPGVYTRVGAHMDWITRNLSP